MNTSQLVKIAKALADPTRHQMLQAIRAAGELNCSQLCALFTLTQPTISHHIGLLIDSGLAIPRKDGPFCVLAANQRILSAYAAAISAPPAKKPARISAAKNVPAATPPRTGVRKPRARR